MNQWRKEFLLILEVTQNQNTLADEVNYDYERETLKIDGIIMWMFEIVVEVTTTMESNRQIFEWVLRSVEGRKKDGD